MKCYVTFGQKHKHTIDGKVFDKDTVAIIHGKHFDECRERAFKSFGLKWCMIHPEGEWMESDIELFPKGYVEL